MKTAFEKNNNHTSTHDEIIDFYQHLNEKYNIIKVSDYGMTDSGRPLQEVIIDKDKDFDPSSSRQKSKAVLFINNGIHPGESCGIDASMLLAKSLVQEQSDLLDNMVIVIIPVYNIGGCLNRSGYSRANQEGPEEHGFRGNAKNLDLNRDFIKCDSKNALSFNKLFTKWMPDVFIDTHTSNGADYQYVMTLIATQKDKLEAPISKFMDEKMVPYLYTEMDKGGYGMIPYVDVKDTPDTGIYDFIDYGRYSTGYAAMHNAIGFMPETHMLKPYHERVNSTLLFLQKTMSFIDGHKSALIQAKKDADALASNKSSFDIKWKPNYSNPDSLEFKGYEAQYKPSEISGQARLYYDRSKPYTKNIPFYNKFEVTTSVTKPKSYIIPQAYDRIIERFKANNIRMRRLESDTIIKVETYKILDYETVKSPYESHYMHYDVKVDRVQEELKYYEGDYIVDMNQTSNRYIVETLEPEAPDSWFAWNFLDGILMQKEYFSSYVFEDTAAEILKNHPEIKKALEAKKAEDEKFADNPRAQLDFIYKRSPYYEPTHKRYPIGRIIK